MNDSTFQAVSTRLETVTRLNVLHQKTKLFCPDCRALRTVIDVFPNRVVTLECKHKRVLFNRTAEEIAAFDEELAKRSGKVVKGSNQKTTTKRVKYVDESGEWGGRSMSRGLAIRLTDCPGAQGEHEGHQGDGFPDPACDHRQAMRMPEMQTR
jgi:hypothetical protein